MDKALTNEIEAVPVQDLDTAVAAAKLVEPLRRRTN